jgi:hypothetical protein
VHLAPLQIIDSLAAENEAVINELCVLYLQKIELQERNPAERRRLRTLLEKQVRVCMCVCM